jgi:hypothetical protein
MLASGIEDFTSTVQVFGNRSLELVRYNQGFITAKEMSQG